MALIKAGWWQTTWFPSRMWQEDYWLEYGTYVPPAPIPSVGRPRRVKVEPRLNPELLMLMRDYLELKTKNA